MSIRRLLVIVAIASIAAACSGAAKPTASKAFCLAADRYNTEIEHENGKVDINRQIARVEELTRTAPKSIARDTQIFLDALRAVRDNPAAKKDDPKVKTAVDNVNRLANQACGVYNRQGGI